MNKVIFKFDGYTWAVTHGYLRMVLSDGKFSPTIGKIEDYRRGEIYAAYKKAIYQTQLEELLK